MHRLHPIKTGLAFGGFMGLMHAFWSLCVGMGFAQPLLDFIFRLHMIKNPYMVMAFNAGTALTLIVVTACIGVVMGYLFAWLWNMVH